MVKIGIKKVKKKATIKSIVSKITNFFTPTGTSYKKYRNELFKKKINMTVDQVVSTKIIFSILSFILLITLMFYYKQVKTNEILNSNIAVQSKNLIGEKQNTVSENQSIVNAVITETINNVNYKKVLKKKKYNELMSSIKNIENNLSIEDNDNAVSKEVFSILFKAYEKGRWTLSNIVLIFLISILSTKLVDIVFSIHSAFIETKVIAEINLIEILTYILVKNTKLSVEELLRKQRDYSKILRPYYDNCLSMYPYSSEKAIDLLKEQVNNKDFNKFMFLIEELLTTDRKTNVKLLEAHKNLQSELIQDRNKIKDDKKSMILTIVSLPLIFIAYVTLFAPMISYAMKSMTNFNFK